MTTRTKKYIRFILEQIGYALIGLAAMALGYGVCYIGYLLHIL